ncbi:hypothetical protein ASE12_18220 [Aeromicrobium sp. Root236]|uniref:hypothetical protein n=1 Tax=Aeromicrobium sp. Root236 TaxID=1736498 RepID=UPI0006F384EE|nr:hypothetical protein [Aeromicrobium sp. Root236]KRC66534.1 hypothetical protein ASE12_18220 [Aeromicrobium sp. Root236]
MTWDAYNRRKETLRDLLAIADRRRDLTLTELLDTVDAGRNAFANETELLFDLQMAWFQRLSGQLDRLVSESVETPELMAVTAWVNAAAEMPGARALLDAHLQEPALAKAFAKEQAFLAASAGVPMDHPDLTGHGRRIMDSARESVVDTDTEIVDEEPRTGLVAKLRSVIAA